MTTKLFGRVCIFIAVYFLIVTVHAAEIADAINAARAHVRQTLAPKVPGLSIAVGHDEKILWSEGFGFADIAGQKPVTTQTQFRIGSISKPLTAAGLMLLVEQGKLDLDADIHRYVPDFPDKGAVITTRQLAGHLAGIRHYRGKEFYSNVHYDSVRASLVIFEKDPLLSKPGEKYSYSSYGYNLISAVMESAAHQKFLDYMQQAVFIPLRMTNTVPDDARRELPQRTCFYKPGIKPTNFILAPAVDNSCKWASGGFLSTPEDLVRFGFAMLHPGFLKSDSLRTMFTPQKTTAGESTGYGIGWSILKGRSGHPVWLHTGGSVGGTSMLMIYPDKSFVMAITCNCDNPNSSSGPLDNQSLRFLLEDFAPIWKGSK